MNCAWDSYESMDAIFANTGAGGDDDGDMDALGRSKGGERVEVRLLGSSWGLDTFVPLDEKDER